MTDAIVPQLTARFDELSQRLPDDNIEFWFARDLMEPLGYARWENFTTAIHRAIESCKSTGYNQDDHFRGVTKMIEVGKGGQRPVADFLPTLTIAAKNLATEMTYHNVMQADLQGERAITREPVQNNQGVRDMLGQRGIKPERLPAEEDIKKLERA